MFIPVAARSHVVERIVTRVRGVQPEIVEEVVRVPHRNTRTGSRGVAAIPADFRGQIQKVRILLREEASHLRCSNARASHLPPLSSIVEVLRIMSIQRNVWNRSAAITESVLVNRSCEEHAVPTATTSAIARAATWGYTSAP